MPDTITQEDMDRIFSVTDPLGISREAIVVPLGRRDPGGVRALGGGQLRITLPASISTEEWLPTLKAELARLGYGGS
ncbi:MAG: hypothetical protein K6U07_07415 [Firmicutes bacterium]|nr:hypothetical protein [Bacillota bacterium]